MKQLLDLVMLIVRSERTALFRGGLLAFTVLAMGVALLGLSGWFISASAAAGLAGVGILFNVFVPSALVRLLALGRTVARYGERLLTHDATLRALSGLRIQLLECVLTRPHRELERLRANIFLNRVSADIDALDGALLRLILPGLAGGAVILVSAVALWLLVHPSIALLVGVGYMALPTLLFLVGQHLARKPARRTEAAMQAGRSRLIDLIAGRDDLSVYGQLQGAATHVRAAFTRVSQGRRQLDRIERIAGAGLDFSAMTIVALTLGVGIDLVQAGALSAPRAAIGVLAALALSEAVAPVRRALSEIGRMTQAARRVRPLLEVPKTKDTTAAFGRAPTLAFQAVRYHRGHSALSLFDPLSFALAPGEMVALTGPSGSGKSTVLLLAAGALTATDGVVIWAGKPVTDWSPDALSSTIGLVPQRHALVAGSIAENLRLAAPNATDDQLWKALRTVCLEDTIENRGGLNLRLGFRGVGLSGGEARRLVLARALLRRPKLLLLDEPTEGLDTDTATQVMSNVRAALPDTAILLAAHRSSEIKSADRAVVLSRSH